MLIQLLSPYKQPFFLKKEKGRGGDCWYQGLALPTSDNNLAIHTLNGVNIRCLA
jgi:hypothetical protein